MRFWRALRPHKGGAKHADELYQRVLERAVDRLASGIRDGTFAKDARPAIEVMLDSGCKAAASLVGYSKELGTAWRNASEDRRVALAEACCLSIMVYMLAIEPDTPLSRAEHYATALEQLLGRHFPEAEDYAVSLFKQKLYDDMDNLQRKETGRPGVSSWAASMALQGAASALGMSSWPTLLSGDDFPVSDSESLRKAGVPLMYWNDQIADTVFFHSLLSDHAAASVDWHSQIKERLSPDEYSEMRDSGVWPL